MGAREESVAYSVFGGEWVDSIGDFGARAGLVRVGWHREKLGGTRVSLPSSPGDIGL